MLARALRQILLVELGVYTGIGVFVVRSAGWSILDSILLTCALWLGLRAVLVTLTFVLSHAWRSAEHPPPKLGVLTVGSLMLKEYLAFIALFSLIQPFERWFMGPDRTPPMPLSRPPILLVHGYLCNRGAYWWLRRKLEKAGYCVATVTLEPVLGSIESCVEPLHRRIEEVCAVTGARRLIIVAHSMGGLVARAYLRQHGAARLAHVITIATPHQGSRAAQLGLGKNAREMRPVSTWLTALSRDPSARLGITAMGSPYDNFVIPHTSQILPQGDNRSLPPVGHLAQAFSREALRALLREIENVSFKEAGEPAPHERQYLDRR